MSCYKFEDEKKEIKILDIPIHMQRDTKPNACSLARYIFGIKLQIASE